MNVLDKLIEPFDERFDLTERIHKSMLDKMVPVHARRYYYCFGGITFFLFVMQILTGIILTFYYVPSPEKAYASVYYISNTVAYGWLIRGIHHWSANLMVVFVILHMLRVFLTASYKHPREFNWVVGIILLMVTMAFSLTGYLLPWDQKAYWASTVTIGLVQNVPIAGNFMAKILMGAETVGGETITRFFSLHIMILPAVLMIGLVAHFWMIRKQGISGPM